MNIPRYAIPIAAAVLLTVAACDNTRPPEATNASKQSNHEDEGGWPGLYANLARGDCLCLGVVKEVRPRSARITPDPNADRQLYEQRGTLLFSVEKILRGPNAAGLRLSYLYQRPAPMQLMSDESGYIWDEHIPTPGLRLLLLMDGSELHEISGEPGAMEEKGPVYAIWSAPEGDPFVEELTSLCSLLALGEPAQRPDLVSDRPALVRRFAASRFDTIRSFVRTAVFAPQARQNQQPMDSSAELVLAFLRQAGPGAHYDPEREDIIRGLGEWFRVPGHVRPAPDELRASFEDWYVEALRYGYMPAPDARGHLGYERAEQALIELNELCEAHGTGRMLSLFPKTGRAGILQHVQACLDQPRQDEQTRLRRFASELLDRLKDKP